MTTITDKIMGIFQKHESKGEALEDDLRELFDLPREELLEELLDELVSSVLDRRAAEQEQPEVATQMYPSLDPDSERFVGDKSQQIGEVAVTSEREEFGNLLKFIPPWVRNMSNKKAKTKTKLSMTAIELFHDHQRNLTARRLEVEKQAEKLNRQVSFFREQLEVMESLGNTDQANNCRKALGDLEGAIEKNEEAMAELDSTRYAEEAMTEILMKRRKLEAEIQDLYQFAVDAQVNFLDKLTRMGELVRESENLQHKSAPIAKVLRQNPVNRIYVGGAGQFEISGAKVRELLRA